MFTFVFVGFPSATNTLRSTFQLVVWFYCVSLETGPAEIWFCLLFFCPCWSLLTLVNSCLCWVFLSAHKVLYKKSYNEKSCKKIYFFLSYLKINVYGEKAFGLHLFLLSHWTLKRMVLRYVVVLCGESRTRRVETTKTSISGRSTCRMRTKTKHEHHGSCRSFE